ncbi:hypothetical protein ACIQAC_10945 [Streptomyces sp. NPDC088387]|uniref:hypothetical protein n=1 Tax=Streptomyces sp. NPDC088387 TaxID=3365859 RepID=UPI003825DFCB
MTTKTRFEDRLLAELQGEIARREQEEATAAQGERAHGAGHVTAGHARAGHGAGGGFGTRAGGGSGTPASRRRLLTRPRLVIAAGVCAVAGFAVTLAPGSPVVSPAYSLERHDDGSVTLDLREMSLGPDAQKELAEKLGAAGIHVTIDDLKPGYRCANTRGESLLGFTRAFLGEDWPPGEEDTPKDSRPDQNRLSEDDRKRTTVVLHPGDSLGIENMRPVDPSNAFKKSESYVPVKGEIGPCRPERDLTLG